VLTGVLETEAVASAVGAACEHIPPAVLTRYLRDAMAGAREQLLVIAAAGSELRAALRPGCWPVADVRVLLGPCDAGADELLAAVPGPVRVDAGASGYLLVVDRAVAILADSPAAEDASPVLVRAPALVAALVANFDRRWHGAVDPLPPAGELTQLRRQIVTGLAAGLTDEAVARRLGICSRTVRRHLTDLMSAFEARSRLELGARLISAGVFPAASTEH
jgi:DNA-binding CsgD family transcriptional regulator